jgi:hypothetical protein
VAAVERLPHELVAGAAGCTEDEEVHESLLAGEVRGARLVVRVCSIRAALA